MLSGLWKTNLTSIKILIFSFLTLLSLTADPLQDFRWKNRILLILPPQEIAKINLQLLKHQKAIVERNLIIINLSESSESFTNQMTLSKDQLQTLRTRYKLNNESKPFFTLIGKDGEEKARQDEQLDLQKIFTLIDSMPMRKAEMKNGLKEKTNTNP